MAKRRGGGNMTKRRVGTWQKEGWEHGRKGGGNMAKRRVETWQKGGWKHGKKEGGNMAKRRVETWQKVGWRHGRKGGGNMENVGQQMGKVGAVSEVKTPFVRQQEVEDAVEILVCSVA